MNNIIIVVSCLQPYIYLCLSISFEEPIVIFGRYHLELIDCTADISEMAVAVIISALIISGSDDQCFDDQCCDYQCSDD